LGLSQQHLKYGTMTKNRDSIGTQEIKKMMAMTGIFTVRARIHALDLRARPRRFFRKERDMSPVHEMPHRPSALTSLALFYHHLLMKVIPEPVSRAGSATARKAISDRKSLHIKMERL
jgi:hypothetical protein